MPSERPRFSVIIGPKLGQSVATKKKGGYVHQILFTTRTTKIFGCAQSKTIVVIQQQKKEKNGEVNQILVTT